MIKSELVFISNQLYSALDWLLLGTVQKLAFSNVLQL